MPVDKFTNELIKQKAVNLKTLQQGQWAWMPDRQCLIYKGYDPQRCEIINDYRPDAFYIDKFNEHLECIPVSVEITMKSKL